MPSRESVFRRSLLVVVLYGMAVAFALSISASMDDPDLWWHLRTGQWIVLHRAIPDAELFSAHHAHERWVAYSWAYDVLVYGLERAFGLFGPLVLSAVLALLVARTLFRLLRTISGSSPIAAALAGAGLVAIAPMLYGRSTMFTIWFALLEIELLWSALVLGETKKLFLVPFVLVVWANVHVQFVYGLFVYACFAGQALLEGGTKVARRLALVGVACCAATLVNPYGVRIYEPLLQYLEQSRTIYALLQELHPPSFDTFDTWVALAIVLAVVVGVVRRPPRKPFLLLLFAVAVVVGARSARDVWFFVATGLPLLAATLARTGAREEDAHSPLLVAIGVALVTAAAAFGISSASLRERLARSVPVAATDFVEAHGLAGPIYNPYDWGGWLLWRLPDRAIAIDGRTWVHSAEFIERSFRTWNAMPGWEEDPVLAAAGVVLGPRDQPLSSALAHDPRFERVYEDAIACVYVRK